MGYTISEYIDNNKPYENTYRSIAIDPEKCTVIFDMKPVAFKDIIKVELVTEQLQTANTIGEKTGGISRAVVGGALAGGAGAVVGAVTAKDQSTTNITTRENPMGVIIYTADISGPTISYEAKYNPSFCREVYATMLAVIEHGKRG